MTQNSAGQLLSQDLTFWPQDAAAFEVDTPFTVEYHGLRHGGGGDCSFLQVKGFGSSWILHLTTPGQGSHLLQVCCGDHRQAQRCGVGGVRADFQITFPGHPSRTILGGIFSQTKASMHTDGSSNLCSRCLSLLRDQHGRGRFSHIISCIVRNH